MCAILYAKIQNHVTDKCVNIYTKKSKPCCAMCAILYIKIENYVVEHVSNAYTLVFKAMLQGVCNVATSRLETLPQACVLRQYSISFTKQYLHFGFILQQQTSINTIKNHNLSKSSVCSMFRIKYVTPISKSTDVGLLLFDLTNFGLISQHGCMVSCCQISCLMLSIHQSRLVSTSSVYGLCVKVFHVKPWALCTYAYLTLRNSTRFLFVCQIVKISGVNSTHRLIFHAFSKRRFII